MHIMIDQTLDDGIRITHDFLQGNEREPIDMDINLQFKPGVKTAAYASYDTRTDTINYYQKLASCRESGKVKACLRHENSHALFARMTGPQQQDLAMMFALNSELSPKVIKFLEEFLLKYPVHIFHPYSRLMLKSEAHTESELGYHVKKPIIELKINGIPNVVSFIGITDEILAWAATSYSHDEIYFPEKDQKKASLASELVETLDVQKKETLRNLGFLNISSKIMYQKFLKINAI